MPGDLLATPTTSLSPARYLQRLRDVVNSFTPAPTTTPPVSVPASLHAAKFVFVRRDAHCSPLQSPYEGPFQVLNAGDKFFTLAMGDRRDTVLIDRLKPSAILL